MDNRHDDHPQGGRSRSSASLALAGGALVAGCSLLVCFWTGPDERVDPRPSVQTPCIEVTDSNEGAKDVETQRAAEQLKELENRHGVAIHLTVGEDFCPLITLPASSGLRFDFPGLLGFALSKYPSGLIRRYVKVIYVCEDLSPYGQASAAAFCRPFTGEIFISGRARFPTGIEASFHHEFAHLLLRGHPLPERQWCDCNPVDFEYRSERGGAGRNADLQLASAVDEQMYRCGFVSRYSMTSIEEDFCEFSAAVFARPRRFRMLMECYPRIRRKYRVWFDYYKAIDRRFMSGEIFNLEGAEEPKGPALGRLSPTEAPLDAAWASRRRRKTRGRATAALAG